MKTKEKNSWMVWAIVALALLNITTVGTILLNRNKLNESRQTVFSAQSNIELGNAKFSGRYFREKLNLDRNQMRRFAEFNQGFRQSAMNINVDLVSHRNEMFKEMSARNCDTFKLNSLSDSIGILHSRLKRETYRYYLDLKEICDDQQDVLLDQLFMEMFTDDSVIGTHGRAYRGGQQ
jgi:hypothetical protein